LHDDPNDDAMHVHEFTRAFIMYRGFSSWGYMTSIQ